jgi:hypothetical protein
MPRSGRSVRITPPVVHFLDEHGAQSDRGRGPRNRSVVLARHLDFYAGILESSDPRSERFPDSYLELTVALLSDPWLLRAEDIHILDAYLTRRPDFGELARRHGVDPSAYESALAALDYNQRLFLVNEAEKRHAPPPPHDET